jgi:hypothetical protein
VVCVVTIGREWLSGGEQGCISILEVAMRPPSVFVRDLLPDGGKRLKRLSRKGGVRVHA